MNKIQYVVLDVDGVLTDGGFYVSDDGHITKKFNARDFDAIRRMVESGIFVTLLTRSEHCAGHFALAVGCQVVVANSCESKLESFKGFAEDAYLGVDFADVLEHMLYCGDTEDDLEMLRACKYPCVPEDAKIAGAGRPNDLFPNILYKGGSGVAARIESYMRIVEND